MPKVLIETRLSSLRLNESQMPRKGCLGRIEGICADYANPTRNGRFYSRALWEKVFNDSLIKESLKSKTLIGELDHPEDRFEPLAKEACVVMTDYRFDDDKQVVYGGFDILDTPSGKILKALLDYGCIMGVSSRGQGDINYNGEYEEVEPNSYEFACFDVVTTPAVAVARQKVTESATSKQKIKGLNNSILEQVENSKSNAELDTILRVIESTGLSNIALIKDAIRNKRKSISESNGKTISDDKLKDDLHEAEKQIKELRRELTESSDKTIAEMRKLRESSSNLSSQVLAYKHRESRLIERIDELNEQLSHQKAETRKRQETISAMRKQVNSLEAEKESLQKSVYESMDKYTTVVSNEKTLKQQITESNKTKRDLQQRLNEQDNEIQRLQESLSREKKTSADALSRKSQTLTESKHSLTETSKLLSSFKNHFVDSICNKYGVNSDMIKSNLPESCTPEQIESLIKEQVDKMDRYSNLPFSTSGTMAKGTKVLSENLKPNHKDSELDAELEHSKWFMEQVAGVK